MSFHFFEYRRIIHCIDGTIMVVIDTDQVWRAVENYVANTVAGWKRGVENRVKNVVTPVKDLVVLFFDVVVAVEKRYCNPLIGAGKKWVWTPLCEAKEWAIPSLPKPANSLTAHFTKMKEEVEEITHQLQQCRNAQQAPNAATLDACSTLDQNFRDLLTQVSTVTLVKELIQSGWKDVAHLVYLVSGATLCLFTPHKNLGLGVCVVSGMDCILGESVAKKIVRAILLVSGVALGFFLHQEEYSHLGWLTWTFAVTDYTGLLYYITKPNLPKSPSTSWLPLITKPGCQPALRYLTQYAEASAERKERVKALVGEQHYGDLCHIFA